MYTHSINYYDKRENTGWVFHTIKTTAQALPLYQKKLFAAQAAGFVRAVEVIELNTRNEAKVG